MGAAASECCTRREDGGACCDLNSSLFGEDAYYRDAFYDCDEGSKAHDRAFSLAREQARLKMRKGKVLAKFASFQVKQQAATAKQELSVCIAPSQKGAQNPDLHRNSSLGMRETRASQVGDQSPSWLGSTIPEWTDRGLPGAGVGPYWSKGQGTGLKVRCGPNYVHTGIKIGSSSSMYETMCCDAIRSDAKIEGIMGNLVMDPPILPDLPRESDRGGGSSLQWTPDCPLPRVICINMMLPYETGMNPWKKDGGCSFVGFFHIKPGTIHQLRMDDPPPAVRLLKEFCNGPAGVPGGPSADPQRSLFSRVQKHKKKDQQAGLFKAIAQCVNPEDVHVPDMFHTYNGKPVLIAKCGYIVKDPAGEWIEIGVDVRGFNILARKMLCSFRHILPQTMIHYGFLVQGVEDGDLPEGLLCDMYLHGINMIDDPVYLKDDSREDKGKGVEEETCKV